MTEQRYLEIRSSYGIYSLSVPKKEVLDKMTEEQCHKTMQALLKAFEDAEKHPNNVDLDW